MAFFARLKRPQNKMPTAEERLITAARNSNLTAVERILAEEKHININYVNENNEFALMMAVLQANVDIVRCLLSRGADVNLITDEEVSSLLHMACIFKLNDIVKILLEFNADVTVSDLNGLSPVLQTLVVSQEEPEAVETLQILCNHCTNLPDKYLRTYYKLCEAIIEKRKDDVIRIIKEQSGDLDFVNTKAESPMYYAVVSKQADLVKLLLDGGCNINLKKTPNAKSVLMLSIMTQCLEVVELLMDHNPDPNVKSEENETTLMIASELGLTRIVQKLLKEGADVHQKDEQGLTALHKACNAGKAPVVKLLVQHKANVNQRCGVHDMSPLEIAVRTSSEVTEILLEAGVDPNERSTSLDHISGGLVPMHWACLQGDTKTVEILLTYGADLTLRSKSGRSVLHYSVENPATLDLLLKKNKVDVDSKNLDGCTPLHDAARTQSCKSCEVLLQHGADIEVTSKIGSVPLMEDPLTKARENKDCKDINCPVVLHFKKLKLLGYEPHSKHFKFFSMYFREDNFFAPIAEYRAELQSLKQTVIGFYPRVSLYSLLFSKSHRHMVRFMDNEILREIYQKNDEDFSKQFPNYGYILNKHYRKCMPRKEVLDEAKINLTAILGTELPERCSDSIFRNLSDQQLVDFNKEEN